MKFITPPFAKKYNPAGTYKIVFNDHWFYIGSSQKLRSRFGAWKVLLSGKAKLKNINIKQLLPQITKVEFVILRIYADDKLIRKAETKLLKKYWENSLLLNRCPEGHTNLGMRPYNGQIREKDRVRLPVGFNRKKVAQFDLQGNLIKIHDSIKAAQEYSGIKDDIIRKVFNGKPVSPQKYVFKGVSSDGSFIEPKLHSKVPPETVRFIVENYSTVGNAGLCRMFNLSANHVSSIAFNRIRKGIVPIEKLPIPKPVALPKPVIKLDREGNVIETYPSIGAAARSINAKASGVQEVIYGRGGRTHYKGFVFKFA